jgi:hypothetical protein
MGILEGVRGGGGEKRIGRRGFLRFVALLNNFLGAVGGRGGLWGGFVEDGILWLVEGVGGAYDVESLQGLLHPFDC